MSDDPNVVDAERRIEDAKASLSSRFEELGRRFKDVKETVDVPSKIADHPWPSVGIAFAVGALFAFVGSSRRDRPSDDKGGIGRTLVAALGALAFRAVKDMAFSQLADLAKSYFADPDAPTQAEVKGSRDPSVEAFLEH